MASLRELGRKYIWGISQPEEVSKVRRSVKHQLNPAFRDILFHEMDAEQLRKLALSEPLFFKAMNKKNKDTFRNGFVIKPKKPTGKVPKKVLKIIDDFNRRTFLLSKFEIAGKCSNIYGTGFLERTFIERKTTVDSPVSKNAKPLGLIPLNSEFINNREKHPKKKDGVLYYVYTEDFSKKVYIHPDRIIALSIDKLPHSQFGVSKVAVLANIMNSKLNSDRAAGEILAWFGHGILDMTITGMDDDQEKDMISLFKQHPSYYTHDEEFELKVHNPTQINPQPFYDYFYTNIAAAFEMPTHILTGQHIGNVTGTEVGISDYYHDIENIQNMIINPILIRIYKQLLEANGLQWDYDIDWNPTFVDEMSEAGILQRRTFSAVQSYNSGIIDTAEARTILNEGVLDLDINKKIEKPVAPSNPTGTEPNVEPQPPKKPSVKQTITFYPLNDVQRKMIEEQRKLGEKELIEQERRLKEAEEKKKKEKK